MLLMKIEPILGWTLLIKWKEMSLIVENSEDKLSIEFNKLKFEFNKLTSYYLHKRILSFLKSFLILYSKSFCLSILPMEVITLHIKSKL